MKPTFAENVCAFSVTDLIKLNRVMGVAYAPCGTWAAVAVERLDQDGTFGGYMTNWIGTQTTRFKCLVSHAGVYCLSGFGGSTDSPAYWNLHMDGEPYTDSSWFDRYAPSRLIAQWRTPTLITHGDKDCRVSVNESLALFEALQFHGVESELLIFPDENHWIMKPNNTISWYQTIFDFLRPRIFG